MSAASQHGPPPLAGRRALVTGGASGIGRAVALILRVILKVMFAPVAIKRLIEPEEVAALAFFLCSKNADSVTGSSFGMDGGWTAH